MMSGVGTPFPAPRAPILVGVRHAWCPAGIRRASRTAGLAASRGHCLRPRGSIRRALGSNITSKVAPARAAGGTPGWLGMAALAGGRGLLCTGTWACPSEGHPMGSGSPEAAAGGPARPPELTAPPPLRGWCSLGAPGRSFKLRGRSRNETRGSWGPLCGARQGVALLTGSCWGQKVPWRRGWVLRPGRGCGPLFV